MPTAQRKNRREKELKRAALNARTTEHNLASAKLRISELEAALGQEISYNADFIKQVDGLRTERDAADERFRNANTELLSTQDSLRAAREDIQSLKASVRQHAEDAVAALTDRDEYAKLATDSKRHKRRYMEEKSKAQKLQREVNRLKRELKSE